MKTIDLTSITDFLDSPTPKEWLMCARENLSILLIDHANCEKKAASNAMNLMYRYSYEYDLCQRLSRLAREELRHYEQVLKIIKDYNIHLYDLSASRYAASLRSYCYKNDPERLIDLLILGAFIEARSCERFAALLPYLDATLGKFYHSLLASEARHFQHYIEFAKLYAESDLWVEERIQFFRSLEAQLITSPDAEFRFHSGIPCNT